MEQRFSEQYTELATVTIHRTHPMLAFNEYRLKTLPIILKIGQMIASLIGYCCITSTIYSYNSRGKWFEIVSMGGFLYSGTLLIFHLFNIFGVFERVGWLKIDFIFCLIFTACNFLAFVLIVAVASLDGALGVAAFFGFLAMVLHGIDAGFKYDAIKKRALTQPQSQPQPQSQSQPQPQPQSQSQSQPQFQP